MNARDVQFLNSLELHAAALVKLDELPRPRNWEEEGSAQYRKDCIRVLKAWTAEIAKESA